LAEAVKCKLDVVGLLQVRESVSLFSRVNASHKFVPYKLRQTWLETCGFGFNISCISPYGCHIQVSSREQL